MPTIDDLTIVDTSETEHIVLLHMIDGIVDSSVSLDELPEWFIERLPLIAEKIELSI